MLDQNTDRMWYVIGAVLVGAAIILIANGTLPQMLASISDSFDEVSSEAIEEVENLGYGENLLSEYVLYDHNDHGALDKSQYDRHGIIKLNTNSVYGGMYIRMSDLQLEPNTEYLMKYKFKKTGGKLLNIGGHTDYAFHNNYYLIDGVRQSVAYAYQNIDKVQLMPDDEDLHTVDVFFKTPIKFESGKNDYDGRISIQPNRGNYENISVTITDLKLVEVLSGESE